jgi:hypothetical protein
MNFRFGFLTDYAGRGHRGKLILVGIFDQVHDNAGTRPIPIPPCFLVVSIVAHATEGANHAGRVVLMNADGQELPPRIDLPLVFIPQGPGRPLNANILIRLDGVTVPDLGDYAFHVLVDNRHVGEVVFSVTPPPTTS